MNNATQHLTSADLDTLLFDREAAAAHPHLLTCAACAADLDSLRQTFAALRSGATAAAAYHQPLAANTAARSQLQIKIPMRLIGSFATAAIAIAIGLPIALRHPAPVASVAHTAPVAPASNPVTPSLSDDQLLASVQSDLSASVPDPMLPLDDNTSTSSH